MRGNPIKILEAEKLPNMYFPSFSFICFIKEGKKDDNRKKKKKYFNNEGFLLMLSPNLVY